MHDYRQSVQQYRQADLGSMTPERLIVALYERMLRDLEDARRAIADGRLPDLNNKAVGVQAVISELRNALDHEVGGEMARNLDALYDYLFQELLLVITDRDPRHLDDCTAVLTPLLEAWRAIPAGAGEHERRRRAETASPGSGPDPASGNGEDRGSSALEAEHAVEGSTLSVTV